jgi:hypothetical protein
MCAQQIVARVLRGETKAFQGQKVDPLLDLFQNFLQIEGGLQADE